VFFDGRRQTWVGKAIVGRDPTTRKPVYEYVRAPTQAECQRLKREAEAKAPAPAAPTMTVAQWCARWLDSLGGKLQTRDDYEVAVRLRFVPDLGALRLTDVTPFAVEQAARKWLTGAGAATVRKSLAILSACLQAAHRAELIPRNPARAAKRPEAPPPTFDLFTADEVRLLVETALARPRLHVFALCAATGCRIGEATGIRSDDYDPATGLLSIRRTQTRTRGLSTPKSRRSARTIRVPLALRPAMERYATPATDAAQRRMWLGLLARLGLRARGLHQLRHTLASHWLAAGVPIADVAAYLGDSVVTVMRTYCHATGHTVPSEVTDALLGGAQGGRKVARPAEVPENKGVGAG
jgi:integrase